MLLPFIERYNSPVRPCFCCLLAYRYPSTYLKRSPVLRPSPGLLGAFTGGFQCLSLYFWSCIRFQSAMIKSFLTQSLICSGTRSSASALLLGHRTFARCPAYQRGGCGPHSYFTRSSEVLRRGQPCIAGSSCRTTNRSGLPIHHDAACPP